MKKIYSYIAALGAVLLLSACDSDLEKVTYNSANAVPATLEEITTPCVLENKKADEVALTLNWKAPELNYSGGYSSAATNYIEVDVAENNFANKLTLSAATIAEKTKSFTHGELNSNILKLLKDGYGMDVEKDPDALVARDFEFRIQTSVSTEGTPVYSNVITVNITPYSMDIVYPEVYVIGNYSGWGWDTAQSLFSFKENEDYEGVIDFSDKAGDGFKITGETNWDNGNYGAPEDESEDEAGEITLVDGSQTNISCYSARFYRFAFNTSTLVLKKNLSFNQFYLVGSDPGIGWDTATGQPMNFDPDKQRFYIDYTFAADAEIKFLTDTNTWFGGDTEGGLNTQDNIKVTAGSYRIYVNLNNSANQTYELNAEDYNK